jgi:hypothetical protein
MVGSRFTHPAEANYSAKEGEMLAQADALQKTKYFTLGCPVLIVGTDHMPILAGISETLEKVSVSTTFAQFQLVLVSTTT